MSKTAGATVYWIGPDLDLHHDFISAGSLLPGRYYESEGNIRSGYAEHRIVIQLEHQSEDWAKQQISDLRVTAEKLRDEAKNI